MKNKKIWKYLSFLLPVLILLVISLFNMYGATSISPLYNGIFKKQILWVSLSIILFLLIYKIDLRFIYKHIYPLYILGLISLLLVLFFGKTINGASSWFKIGAVSIQPSEIVKCIYIITLAKLITNDKHQNFTLLLKIIIFSLIPCVLIFLEPDTGVVVMYLLIMFGEILASKIKKRYLVMTIGSGIGVLGIFIYLYFFKQNLFISIVGNSFYYRIDRLLSFKNNTSYQLTNALIGIGASGSRGFGLLSKKIYVPEITTDFVFDLTILNFGYITGFIVLGLYTFFLIRLYLELKNTKTIMNKCILSGIFFLMLFQIFEHIFMNIGLTPITGITLPFLSYGGSSLFSYAIILAIIIKITTNNSSYN